MPGHKPPVPRAVVVTALLSALVAAGAFITAFAMRPAPAGPPDAAAEVGCQMRRCTPMVSTTAAGDQIQLLATGAGDIGSLRAGRAGNRNNFDVTITSQGARLNAASLTCAEGATPACLVRGDAEVGKLGEVFVSHQGGWSQTDVKFISNNGYLALHDVLDDTSPEVVAVQRLCPDEGQTDCATPEAYFAQVLSLTGAVLGCTTPVAEVSSMPGYPDVAPDAYNVHSCEQ